MSKLADLSDFIFQLQYKPSRVNKAADALSRNPVTEDVTSQNQLVEFVQDNSACVCLPDELVVNVAEQNLDCMEVVSQGQNIGFVCSYSLQDMKNMQDKDTLIAKLKKAAATKEKPKDIPHSILKHWVQFQIVDGVVYRNVTINGLHKQLLVVPVSLVPLILQQLHDFAGHQGIERTTALVRDRFYWPSVLSRVV